MSGAGASGYWWNRGRPRGQKELECLVVSEVPELYTKLREACGRNSHGFLSTSELVSLLLTTIFLSEPHDGL